MSNNEGLVSWVIAKLHQHKAKEFGKLKYAYDVSFNAILYWFVFLTQSVWLRLISS